MPVSTIMSRSRPRTCQMLQRMSGITCGSQSSVIESSIVRRSNQWSAIGSATISRTSSSSGLVCSGWIFLARLGATASARPASSGTRAATGRPADLRPGRATIVEQRLERLRLVVHRRPRVAVRRRPGPARWRSSGRAGRMRRQLVPRERGTRPGARSRARTDHGANTVLCGAFWLKSMKIRAPRSSFHHAAVMSVGSAPLELAGDGHGRGAHGDRVPRAAAAARRRAARGCPWS